MQRRARSALIMIMGVVARDELTSLMFSASMDDSTDGAVSSSDDIAEMRCRKQAGAPALSRNMLSVI
jgi:hypothetical protein